MVYTKIFGSLIVLYLDYSKYGISFMDMGYEFCLRFPFKYFIIIKCLQ